MLQIIVICIFVALCSFFIFKFGIEEQNHVIRSNTVSSNMFNILTEEENSRNNISHYERCMLRLRGKYDNKLRLLFLKTHKTGSSTVSSILWRQLCMRSVMNCFLPPASHPGRTWDFSRNDHKKYVQESLGTQQRRLPFDVWLSHAKYHSYLEEIVPAPRLFVSIVRRPALRFQSAWHWYSLEHDSISDLESFIRVLLSKPDSAARSAYAAEAGKLWRFRTGLDSSAQELVGMNTNFKDFQSRFDELLRQIVELEVFVLVNERFEESLLVLQWLLGWDNHDEARWFLPRKVQSYQRIVNETLLQVLDDIQPYDLALYHAANHALDRMVAALEGLNVERKNWRLSTQLLRLKQQLHSLSLACNTSESRAIRQQFFENVRSQTEHNISQLCELLQMDNDNFVQMFWNNRKNEELR